MAKEKKEHGRPKRYSQEVADQIIQRLTEQMSLNKICKDPEMPARSTVYTWIVDNHDGFTDKYVRAKGIQVESLLDEIMEWCDKAIEDPSLTYAIKLKIDSLKWVACKLIPKKYGEKQEIQHSGTVTIIDDIK